MLSRTLLRSIRPTLFVRPRTTFVPNGSTRVKKPKTKEELDLEKLEADLKSPSRFIRWGAIARTDKFRKGMTKYLIIAYIGFLLYGYKFMMKLREKETKLEELTKKQNEGASSEYDELILKKMKNKMRRRDELKLAEYEALLEENPELDVTNMTLPTKSENVTNEKILPARDTTPFYEMKAEEYDEGVDFEEKMIFMGSKRKWLMKHCVGDVLEVACGTGRNIPFLDLTRVRSVTFMDASEKMMEIANDKFRKQFPNYKNAAFVVGKAEDLVTLASGSESCVADDTKVKYDTIVEAFGLCSHEDPVKALKNFSSLLKPGGRIVLLEHGRGQYDFINNVLDNRAEKRLATWGCRWNLDLGEILDDSGLEVVEERRVHMGTTWCIVAKRKGDDKKSEEIGFVEKYIGSSFKKRAQQFIDDEKPKSDK